MRRLLLFSLLLFGLVGISFANPPVLTETEKINRLIQYIRTLDGAVFIRNGSEHSPAEAAEHMKMKRDKAPKYAKTAREFILNIASKSSFSGKPYHIRFKDGKTLTAEEVLMRELKRIESQK